MIDTVERDLRGPGRLLGWGSIVVAVLALAQPLLATATVLHVLSGALDETYGLAYDETGQFDPEATVSFWRRWEVSIYAAAPGSALLTGAVVTSVLAGLHLAGAGRWRLPRSARVVAITAGAVTALVAAVDLVLLLAWTRRPPENEYASYGWGSEFVNLTPPIALAAAVTVFAAAATAALLGRPVPPPVREDHPPLAGNPEREEPEPEPEPEQVEPEPAEPEIPRLPEEDLAWYRRPPS